MSVKLLIGGSPCTYWSIARSGGREVTASGIGWELFRNYLIAKERFQPDYFLYENNSSAAQEIKDQISKELDVALMDINSATLSAQKRARFYAFNWSVLYPIECCDVIRDIMLPADQVEEKYWYRDLELEEGLPCKAVQGKVNLSGHENNKKVWDVDRKSPTLTCDGKGGNLVKKIMQDGCVRKLTPIEYERLQTLPDNYTAGISDSQRYNCIGNGWTAEVIIHILNGALGKLDRDEEIIVLSMYDGISTGRYCLEKMGFKNVKYYSFEIDSYALMISQKNYPDIIQLGNANQIRNNNFNIDGLLVDTSYEGPAEMPKVLA